MNIQIVSNMVVCNEMSNSIWKIGRKQDKSNAWKGGLPSCLECGKKLSKYGAKYCRKHFSIQYKGDKHPAWKSDNANYFSIHSWIQRILGKATVCTNSNCLGNSNRFEWANISGEYKRDLSDWRELCHSCHMIFDNVGKKVWDKRRANG